MPNVGDMAPEFEMINDEGKLVKLSDYRGKKVVLYFYPNDFTSGCELQACNFRDNYDKFAAKNAVVLGVSHNDLDSHKRFREALNLPFSLLVDPDYQYAKAWGCWGSRPGGTPPNIGLIRSQFIIDESGKIVDVQRPVKAPESLALALQHV